MASTNKWTQDSPTSWRRYKGARLQRIVGDCSRILPSPYNAVLKAENGGDPFYEVGTFNFEEGGYFTGMEFTNQAMYDVCRNEAERALDPSFEFDTEKPLVPIMDEIDRENILSGLLNTFTFSSTNSKIFAGGAVIIGVMIITLIFFRK